MFLQSMSIVAALLFVLGLVAVAVWVAKRMGAVPTGPRNRVAIEVVQRVSMGPKTGLAVVRVGEKVMAVSMGPDGMRPLFELDEADRQRVLATSTTAPPFASSVGAGRAIGNFLPPTLARMFQRHTVTAPVSFADSMKSALNPSAPATHMQPVSTPPEPVSAAERDFRSMLNIAMSGATRLAVFGGVFVLSAVNVSSNIGAQAAPPVVTAPAVTAPAQIQPVAPPSNSQATPSNTQAGATNQPVTQPAAQPPSQPAAQPPSQPAAQPPSQPAAQPPSQPAAQPATQPTTLQTPQSGATNTTQPVTPGASGRADAIVPRPPVATPPAFVTPTGSRAPRTANVRPAQTRVPLTSPGAQARAQSSATDSTKRTPQPKAPTSSVLPGTAPRGPTRSSAAPTAPVAGGDEALANMLPQMDLKMGDGKDGGLRLSGTVGIVVMMGLLTLVPTLVLMMTGFTRILIVLHFLKQAMGTQSAPPAQLLAAMALLLTGFVMAPTLTEVNRSALTPWMDGQMTQVEMLREGVKPMRVFMLKQTRESDLKTFIELSRLPRPNTVDDVPLHVLMSAFVASELRRAFQIGFMVYLPFIIIDAVVASVLMSMGMFMLPPAMISMPFKLLLFVLVDGWGLIITALINSFK